MHTIWLREHNRIADELQALNPKWDQERVFQTARQIVGAEIQKITYKDYLPLILGASVFSEQIGDYTGYNSAINPGVPNAFSTAAYRFGHSQIQPMFERLDSNFEPIDAGPLNLLDAFFNPSQFAASGGTDPILRGLISNSARKIDEFLNNVLTNHLFQSGSSPGLDLASLNIQRGRDHGLPPYMTWKRWAKRTCGISSEFKNQLTFIRLLQTYGSLETVDLWVGGLAEERLPGSLVGATFACIFANTFTALRDGDRFYYENDDETALFKAEQRAAIEKVSLSRIICDNADNIQEIQPNAFRLDQQRVSCSEIPVVNLSAWKERILPRICYIKASLSGKRSFRYTFRSYSKLIQSLGPIHFGRRRVSGTRGSFCLPFRCPETGGRAAQLVVAAPRVCSVTPNTHLSPNRVGSRRVSYVVNESHISATNGIYTDVSICKSGSAISALQYSCTRSEQQNNGKELLNKLEEAVEQQNADNEEDIEEDIPLGDPQIPDDIRHLFENVGTVEEIQSLIKNTGDKSKLISMLEEYLHDLKEEASSNNAKSTRNQKEELEKSDAQLVSQLEQALSHI